MIEKSFSFIKNDQQYAIVMGNFDGVHVGHQELLKYIVNYCDENKLIPIIVTFNPHPQKILRSNVKHFLLINYQKKYKLLNSTGIKHIVEIPFTRDFSSQSPEEFVKFYIKPHKCIKAIFVGHDFSFGANKNGDESTFKKLCPELNVINLSTLKIENISSSIIRNLINAGDVKSAFSKLGRYFSLDGIVVKGKQRGREIGFPTANIICDNDLIYPLNGVYSTYIWISSMRYQSITNVGINPTFGDISEIHIETHIFDFDKDIYGEVIEVEFIDRIRTEKKFKSVNELIAQIKQDCTIAKDMHNGN